MIGATLGSVMIALSATLLYLAAPHQRWGRLPCKPSRVLWLGLVLLVAGTILLFRWAGTATAIFIGLTILMAVWSLVPLAVAWWRGIPETK